MHSMPAVRGREELTAVDARDSPVVVEALGADVAGISCETCCGLALLTDGIRARRVAIEKNECVASERRNSKGSG